MPSTTPNFGFTIPSGSDTVNLLTQNYPNWTSLDSILQAVKDNGVSTATHTKAGTVHQLARTVTSCNIFRFVATANYTAGDTFTVDGNAVTATAVNGTSLSTGAFVINQNVVCVINGAVLTVLVAGSDVSSASDVTYDNTGSGLTATDVQDALDEIYSAIPSSMSASDVTYDNSGSGLTATNAQDAIDELASGSGGSVHGIYELWLNSDITATFAPQTITFTTDLINDLDALILVCEPVSNEGYGAQWFELEMAKANVSPFTPIPLTSPYYSSGAHYCRRAINDFTTSGTSISIEWAGGYLDSTANNNAFIPVRVLGLIHNS